MKKLIVILGPSAVGKSSVCRQLIRQCPNSAMVDIDWLRQTNPSEFTNATKQTVTDNLYDLISNYLCCNDIQWVFFAFGLHGEQEGMLRELIRLLQRDQLGVQIHTIVLKAPMEELIRRGKDDGRDTAQIERGILQTYSVYDDTAFPCIDTSALSLEETADAVQDMLGGEPDPFPRKKRDLRPLWTLLLIPVILLGFLLGRCTAPDPVVLQYAATEETAQTTSTAVPTTASTEPSAVPTTEPPPESSAPTEETTLTPTEEAHGDPTSEPAEETSAVMDYIVNINSLKFHYPDCESVGKMKETNKEYFTGTREELIERGCDPCGNCKP